MIQAVRLVVQNMCIIHSQRNGWVQANVARAKQEYKMNTISLRHSRGLFSPNRMSLGCIVGSLYILVIA